MIPLFAKVDPNFFTWFCNVRCMCRITKLPYIHVIIIRWFILSFIHSFYHSRHNIRDDHADLPVTIHELQQRQEEYAAAATAFDAASPLAPPTSGYQGVVTSGVTSGSADQLTTALSPTAASSTLAPEESKRRISTIGAHGDIMEKHHQVRRKT